MKLQLSGVLLLMLTAAGCTKSGEATAPLYDTVKVERRAIVVAVEAAGTIEPVTTVELKSKASGEILDMKAETGDEVAQGTLLVRIDPRTARNRLSQSEADLTAARARLSIAAASSTDLSSAPSRMGPPDRAKDVRRPSS